MSKLDEISIKGYKSIQSLENFELTNLNILIGANGAGKSNFIAVFKLLADIYAENLQLHVQKNGGVEALLHYGRKKTDSIKMKFYFGLNDSYQFTLIPTVDNRLIFENEIIFFPEIFDSYTRSPKIIGKNHSESLIKSFSPLNPSLTNSSSFIRLALESLRVYHFHDTSDSSKVKQIHSVYDNLKLKDDAANLSPFLKRLKQKFPENYKHIIQTIRLVAPFFDDFLHRENEQYIQLEWFEKGNPDTPFKAHVLSDGTLRFICLATLLLQPFELMNDTILIDEPELGLHPYALTVLSDLIKRASEKKQLIISTQSVELINHFSAEDIIVVDRVNDASTFKRLDAERLSDWLEDYSLGELWTQNVLGGRPTR
jgi:predicted ATPase